MTELTYNEKQLNPNPLEMSLSYLAGILLDGDSASVTLEPGDGTRYEFVLTPMEASNVEILHWSPEDRQNGLLVVRLVGGKPIAAEIVILDRSHWQFGAEFTRRNEWTFSLFNWWFTKLAMEVSCEAGDRASS